MLSGAGSGIGRAACSLLAREGAKVIAADRNVKAAEDTAAALQGNNPLLLVFLSRHSPLQPNPHPIPLMQWIFQGEGAYAHLLLLINICIYTFLLFYVYKESRKNKFCKHAIVINYNLFNHQFEKIRSFLITNFILKHYFLISIYLFCFIIILKDLNFL